MTKHRPFTQVVFTVVAGMVLFCPPLFGQFRSSIEGTVSDTSGAVVPDTKVVLTNTDNGVTQTAQSNNTGYFRFPSLGPGNYKLTASKQGFQTLNQENISLLAQEIRTVPMVMKVGQIQESVTVTTESTPVQLSEAKIASDISARELHELPLAGRNVLNVLSETPGVTGVGTAQQTAGGTDIFSLVNNPFNNANGQRGDGNSFYVDNTLATSNPDPGSYNLTPNPDSVQELHVAVNDYSAESGRSGSLVIQAVTKSGTNQFHGSLFEYHQDNKLTARNHFQSTPDSSGRFFPAFRRNEFGGSVGGPIQKDKMFFFFSWDQKRSSSPTTITSTVEHPDFVNFMKTNFPNNTSTTLMNNFPAVTVHGFEPGSVQTAQDLDPNCSIAGPPVAGMPCNLNILGTTVNTFSLPNNGLQWNVRIDRYFRDSKDRVYGNFYRKTPDTISPNVRPAFNNKNSFAGTTNYINLDWTHTFSPNMVNDAAVGFTRISGLGSCSHCEVPGIFSHLADFGTGFAPAEFIQNDFHWRDVLSFTHGRHALKVGFDIFRDQENDLFNGPTERPSFVFVDNNSVTHLDSVFDFANDRPTQEPGISFDLRTGALANQSIGYRSSNFGFFMQDDWKAKSNLSINYGLRWDFNSNPNEINGQMSQVILGQGSNLLQQISNASVQIVPSLLRTHRIGYLAPRLSFAWDPTREGKLSIRGGIGVFFTRAPNIVWSDAIRGNPPFIGNVTADIQQAGPQPGPFQVCGSASPPFNCSIPSDFSSVIGLNARGGASASLSAVGGTDPGLRQAYSINRFFGAQYALTPNWIFEADYTGSQSVHLYAMTDRNRCLGCIDSSGAAVRPNPFFANITFTNNDAWSHANGATFSVLHRFSQAFSFQAAFNIIRVTSVLDSTDVGRASSQARVFDPYNLNLQRGPSSFEVPQSFTVHGLWELPRLSRMNPVLRGIFGGWQWSGALSLQAGYPYTVFDCTHSPDGAGGCVLPNVAASERGKNCGVRGFLNGCLDPTAFTLPCPLNANGVLNCGSGPWEGNVGRNSFRGPGFANVDFSTMKYFQIPWFSKEGARLQIRGEFFNLFNRTNLQMQDATDTDLALDSVSGTTSLNSNFGKATGIYNPRTIQVGVRLEF
jgi:Carboxypeptidase regulatory-like domain/TonB dependent receptor